MEDERTIYDEEKTQYQRQDEEATMIDESLTKESTKVEGDDQNDSISNQSSEKRPMWRRVAVGTGSGILLGTVASLLTGSATSATTETLENENEVSNSDFINEEEHVTPSVEEVPDWTDGEVPIAVSTNDNMSFSDAFEAARTEVGSGGVFQWHGNIYSTYTEEEWDSMTIEDKNEYGSHFTWHSESLAEDEIEVIATDNESGQISQNYEVVDDDVDVVEVIHSGDVTDMGSESDVEIIDVIQDEYSYTDIKGEIDNNQDAIEIDVDAGTLSDDMEVNIYEEHFSDNDDFFDLSDQTATVSDMDNMSTDDGYINTTENNDVDFTEDYLSYE